MNIYTGKRISDGYAIGELFVIKNNELNIENIIEENSENKITEKEHLSEGLASAKQKLIKLYNKTYEISGQDAAQIFEAQQVLLDDPVFLDAIFYFIENEGKTAEYAVIQGTKKCLDIFLQIDDEFMKQRSSDIQLVSDMILKCLLHKEEKVEIDRPVIILAEDITTEQLISIDRKNILAIVTNNGTVNSHVSILAGSMNIPMIINAAVDISEDMSGSKAAVDCVKEEFYIFPDDSIIDAINKKIELRNLEYKGLNELMGLNAITKSGKSIKILANANSLKDVGSILDNDAEGIGLFRTEYIYIDSDELPDEEGQFNVYKTMLQQMEGKNVTIRTFDIGVDKIPAYLNFPENEYETELRGIRFALKEKEMFKTQLRALFRASLYGNMSIMFPMITSEDEVKQVLDIISMIKTDLTKKDLKYGEPKIGIMIETPEAAFLSDKLAAMIDFFSIGTNDLTQYTLGIDRQDQMHADLYDPHDKTVLDLIEMVVKNGHKHNIKVSICGELASDKSMTKYFMDIGIDELSVSAAKILPLRKMIREFE